MKFLYTITAVFAITFYASAQTNSFQEKMRQVVQSQSEQSTADELHSLETQSQKLSEQFPNEPLAYYYTAYYGVLQMFMESDVSLIDEKLDFSENYLQKAEDLSGDNSEISCLKSMISSARITVNPAKRGMKYGRLSSQYQQMAVSQNPNNPRVYYLMAMGVMYMPVAYGGGCDAAKPLIDKSISLFKVFVPETNIHPNWGLEEVKQLQSQCNN